MNAIYDGRSERLMDRVELVLHAVGLCACWILGLVCLTAGMGAYARMGSIPTGLHALVALAQAPDVVMRLEASVICVLGLTTALVLVGSAIEGSWWMARKLSRL